MTNQFVLDTYASEIEKLAAVWRRFDDAELSFRPHERSTTVGDIMKHELLSARRFFGEFLGLPEPPAMSILPPNATVEAYVERMTALARPRIQWLADQPESWWTESVSFFDVTRQRA